ncbi:MAG: YdcF family protein [Defluviitaleaceae bacterium]|nr:YdcF family protein [Defluviitaleaceae bacterium]
MQTEFVVDNPVEIMKSKMVDDITKFIFVEDAPQKVDIIFMPGDSNPNAPEKAAILYNEGYSPLLLPSGGTSVKTGKFSGVKVKAEIYNGDYQFESDFYEDVLIKNGVPKSAIIKESAAGYTLQNAFMSREVADKHNLTIKKAIICCKSFHARRCLMLYQCAFPETELLVVPVDVYGISSNNWHKQAYGIDRVFGELSRCGNQFVPNVKQYLGCAE